MSALQIYCTAQLSLVFALPFRTVSQLWIRFEIRLTESAFLLVLLFFPLVAVETYMIRFNFALRTKVVSAIRTPYSILTHMFCRCFVNLRAIVFLIVIIDLPSQYFDIVSTIALHKIFRPSQSLIYALLLQLFILLNSNDSSNFKIINHFLAVILNAFYIGIALSNCFL